MLARLLAAIAAMVVVVAASNILVLYPLQAQLGPVNLADLLTWGAFTFPFAFLITDLTNRFDGPRRARLVVLVGRSEERRVGKECMHECRSRWSPYH